ncbi:DUF748 domain-containing protein [Oxalobacter paraformigenes]|uniref:DUF748 domain-containing protein n=1 Tax=Oxalobacter paraformigenes TaxID=556268 RepID=C3X6X0_9BURK|nr:DUF748 domain-containing protein [Oxalobacter paraformigenes]EEO26883.1 hypothetical protein OFAG_00036 [Oxalobacter paraformigenes]
MREHNISGNGKRSRIKRTIALFLAFASASLIVAIVAAVFFLPGIVQSKAREFAAENFNRELTVQKIELDPFRLTVRLEGVRLSEPGQERAFVSFDHLFVEFSPRTFSEFNPVIRQIRLVNPTVHIVRRQSGKYNVDDMVTYLSKPREDDAGRTLFSINNIRIENGTIRVDDDVRKKRLLIEELNVGIPFIANMPAEVEVFVPFSIRARINRDKIELVGKSRPVLNKKDGTIGIKLDKLDLPTYLGYLPFDPGFKLKSGKLSADLDMTFAKREGDKRPIFVEGDVVFHSLRLTESDNAHLLDIPELKIGIGKSDLVSGKIKLNRVSVENPRVFLERNKDGQWNFERLVKAGKKPAEKTGTAENEKTASRRTLAVDLKQFVVNGGQLHFLDRAYNRPVNISARNFGLNVVNLSLDVSGRNAAVDSVVSTGTRITLVHSMPELLDRLREKDKAKVAQEAMGTAADSTGFHFRIRRAAIKDWSLSFENRQVAQPIITRVSRLEASAENLSDSLEKNVPLFMQAKVNDRGAIVVKGNIAVSPLKADLDMDVREVDIRFIQPYIDSYVNLSLKRADMSVKGKLRLEQEGTIKGHFSGGAAIGSLAAVDQLTGRPVISWKDLAFEGIAVNLNPLSVTIDKAKMSDVIARVILLSDGRLNLQNILRSKAGGQKSLAENEEDSGVGANSGVSTRLTPSVYAGNDLQAVSDTAGNNRFPIAVKKWIIRNGSVRFSDNFIKPRYTANILNLRGAFINLSNDPEAQSRLGLKGQVNGAPLIVSGYINPLSESLSLNIKAQITGMELAQFSAYSGKYLGYGIEKGKLSYKAIYKVEDGKLTAENALVLDQLTLGEKVESEEAADLSIELALALLKDSDGVIDINVPIAGSLNDPEFSLGSIVGKVVLNTLKKIVTAPFAFLASLNENEKALSGMVFEPGSSVLTEESERRLERIAKGLVKRPKIRLEITGRYDDVADRAGLGESTLNRKILALKRKKQGALSFEEIRVSEEEYPVLLKEVYWNEKFDKPKKLLVFDKEVSVAEMEKQLVGYYSSRNDSLILLANRRAETVKNWLVLKGKLSDERIYLLASKQGEAERDKPAHRVDFNLRWKN